MSPVTSAASVGAGASQVRTLNTSPSAPQTDQRPTAEDVRVVALRLITAALSVESTTGHYLDALA